MHQDQCQNSKKVFIIMIGLPCRGKSYFSKKLSNYLIDEKILNQIFNLGKIRREVEEQNENCSYQFFSNFDSQQDLREKYAEIALQQAIDYLKKENNILSIYDGTNTTIERRKKLWQVLKKENFQLIWIECISNDNQLIEKYIKLSKIHNDDYKGKKMSQQEAFEDFKQRIEIYKQQYKNFSDEEKQLVKNDQNQSYLYIGEFGKYLDFQYYKQNSDFNKKLKNYLLHEIRLDNQFY